MCYFFSLSRRVKRTIMSWLAGSFCWCLLNIFRVLIRLSAYGTWEITCDWQNYSFVLNKCLSNIVSNFSNNKNGLWKIVWLKHWGFQNHIFNSFQSSSLTIRAFFCICCYLYLFSRFERAIFCDLLLNLVAVLGKFRDIAPSLSLDLWLIAKIRFT